MGLPLEYCTECNDPTGRAGAGEDSLYTESGHGPYCEVCWDNMRCNACDGDGEVPHMVNRQGLTDYLTGAPSGLTEKCQVCDGDGYRPEIYQ